MANVIDLDAFLAEEESNAPEFHFRGHVWKCPTEIPYVGYVKARALWSGKSESDIGDEDLGRFIEVIYGKKVWEEMQEAGVGLKMLSRIVQETSDYLLSTLPSSEDADEGEGGPKAASA